MPIFQRAIKTIQHADDGPGALGSGEDTEALTWDNGTGKFVTSAVGGGGGVSLSAANTWTRQQTIQSAIADVSLSNEYPDNSDFADDLTSWDDTDSAGWVWDTGAAVKPPVLAGSLTQSGIGINEGYLYVFAVQITGMTAGTVGVRVIENESTSIYLAFSENGTQQASAVLTGPTADISIYADEFFDGRVEYVSLKSSNDGYPPNIVFKDFSGNAGGAIKAASNKLIIGDETNPSAQIVQFQAAVTIVQPDGNVALKDAQNVFTQPQQFTIDSVSDASLLQNSTFDSDIADWDDSGSSWAWNAAGAAEHIPGSGSVLSQTFAISGFSLYVLSISVTNVTAGSMTVSDDFGINGLIDSDATIVFPAQYVSGSSNTIYLTPSSDFAGLVDYVTAQPIRSAIALLDITGSNTPARIFGTSNAMFLQLTDSDPSNRLLVLDANHIIIGSAIVDLSALPTSPGDPGTAWVDEASDNVVKRA